MPVFVSLAEESFPAVGVNHAAMSRSRACAKRVCVREACRHRHGRLALHGIDGTCRAEGEQVQQGFLVWSMHHVQKIRIVRQLRAPIFRSSFQKGARCPALGKPQ